LLLGNFQEIVDSIDPTGKLISGQPQAQAPRFSAHPPLL